MRRNPPSAYSRTRSAEQLGQDPRRGAPRTSQVEGIRKRSNRTALTAGSTAVRRSWTAPRLAAQPHRQGDRGFDALLFSKGSDLCLLRRRQQPNGRDVPALEFHRSPARRRWRLRSGPPSLSASRRSTKLGLADGLGVCGYGPFKGAAQPSQRRGNRPQLFPNRCLCSQHRPLRANGITRAGGREPETSAHTTATTTGPS